MTMTTPDIDFKLLLDDEPQCESGHHDKLIPVCSQHVAAAWRTECGMRSFLICQNIVDVIASLGRRGHPCGNCFKPITDCWKVHPV